MTHALGNKDSHAQITKALRHLIDARDLLKAAEAPKTTARVRLAISSCKGALRSASYRFAIGRTQT